MTECCHLVLGVSYIFWLGGGLEMEEHVKCKRNDVKDRATGSSSISGTLGPISHNMETRVICASNSVRENAYFPSRWFKVNDELFRWNLSWKEAVEIWSVSGSGSMMSYSKGRKLAFKCRITLETRGCIFSICCTLSLRFHPADTVSLKFTSTGILQSPSNLLICNTLKLNVFKANIRLYKGQTWS